MNTLEWRGVQPNTNGGTMSDQPVSTSEQVAREIALAQVEREYDSRIRDLRAQNQLAEARAEAYARESTIENALAGVEFVNETAKAQAKSLLRDRLHVTTTGSTLDVRGPHWQPAGEFIKEQLASEAWQHFRKPGSTPTPSTPSTPSPPAASPPAGQQREGENLGQAYLRRFQESQAARQASDPRMDIRRPFGLRRIKP
jgi:hypothetical protein